MQSHFGPDFFSANRARLRQTMVSDVPIVICGNGTMQRGSDEPSPFHQDSNFWYLTGLNVPDMVLVILKDETYLMIPGLSISRQAFDGAHDIASYVKRSGITTILDERQGWQRLRSDIQAGQVATLASLPPYVRHYGIHSLPYRRRLISRLKRLQPNIQLQDIRSQLATLRCLKQPAELATLQQAIDITTGTLQDIAGATLQQSTNEYELDAALSYGFRKRGATGHAFAPIVGAGKHATTLHYLKNDGPMQPSDLVVLDVGAEVEHYAADITRTVSKQPITNRSAEVFQAVCRVQDYALGLIKPGVLARDYELAVEQVMGNELIKLGLITKPSHQAIRRYYPHATSHFLGLDTHDVGDYRLPWQANMVITCEPGIYIAEEGIGVRIEDDICITETGYKNLSIACPRELTPVQ